MLLVEHRIEELTHKLGVLLDQRQELTENRRSLCRRRDSEDDPDTEDQIRDDIAELDLALGAVNDDIQATRADIRAEKQRIARQQVSYADLELHASLAEFFVSH